MTEDLLGNRCHLVSDILVPDLQANHVVVGELKSEKLPQISFLALYPTSQRVDC